jgi:hypothetical protein
MARGDFALVTHPEHAPAVDFLTRTGEGPFVDTGFDVFVRRVPGGPVIKERVYLSVHNISQLAELAGSVQTSSGRTLHEEKLIAQGKVEALKEGLGDRITALAADLRSLAVSAGLGSDPLA